VKRPRYKVATCTGWQIGKSVRRPSQTPGCTASVLDTLNAHREVRRFRSEDRRGMRLGRTRGVEGAKRAAREYADKLNAAHERG
jgi:hypothetical protein